LPEYEVEGVRRKLYCRQATNLDSKKQDCHGHKSQYYQWKINKQKLNTYVKRQAHSEIMKTKGINRENKHHQITKDAPVKREKKEDSSSGVQDSEEMAD
jgi:alpha-galactosidase/6-phospho-beta-glucosidase family protein